MDLFLSIFPIVLLIYLMVKRNAFPSYVALPLIAGIVYILQLFYFKKRIYIAQCQRCLSDYFSIHPYFCNFRSSLLQSYDGNLWSYEYPKKLAGQYQ